ncbi:unnamed protein product [Pedinophyceae sp. YPF-701]|nr:unnamed protein product [Pedinophyceae sp. YPF-701]
MVRGSAAARAGVKDIVDGVKSFFRPPWKNTGPPASPEWKEAVPDAKSYRAVAPGNQAVAQVPWAEPENIYDIKYFPRDKRRWGSAGGLKVTATQVRSLREGTAGQDIPGGTVNTRGYPFSKPSAPPLSWMARRSTEDQHNNGYT